MTRANFLPAQLSELDLAFGPRNVYDLFPPVDRSNTPSREARKVVSDWFFCGLKELLVEPCDGIDPEAATRHIGAILRSFQPKHEEKEWAAATLFDLWFECFTWEANK